MTSLQETAMGGGPATAKTANYVLVAADAGTTVAMNAAGATTITVNTGLFAAGDTVFIQNLGAGACTVTAGTATVATAGSLILPQNDAGILYFTSASAAIFYDYIQVGATSPLTTKGDLYTYSTSDTRLAVGTNGHTLVADSSTATGLKWAAPSASATSYALINTGGTSLSSTTTTITGLSGYNKLMILAQTVSTDNNNADITVRFNSDTGSNYTDFGGYVRNTDGYSKEFGIRSITYFNSTGLQFMQLANISTSSGDGFIEIDGANSTGIKTTKWASGANNGFNSSSYDNHLRTAGGYYKGTSVISSVSFISGNGSFDSGTIYIYGAN